MQVERDAPDALTIYRIPAVKRENIMAHVTGIGGVFIKATNPEKLRDWYHKHLGIDIQSWGGATFHSAGTSNGTTTVTSWMISDGSHFAPSDAAFMINYRVTDLHALLDQLRAAGCQVLNHTEESEFGSFGWVIDPEGNKIELWQAPQEQD